MFKLESSEFLKVGFLHLQTFVQKEHFRFANAWKMDSNEKCYECEAEYLAGAGSFPFSESFMVWKMYKMYCCDFFVTVKFRYFHN